MPCTQLLETSLVVPTVSDCRIPLDCWQFLSQLKIIALVNPLLVISVCRWQRLITDLNSYKKQAVINPEGAGSPGGGVSHAAISRAKSAKSWIIITAVAMAILNTLNEKLF